MIFPPFLPPVISRTRPLYLLLIANQPKFVIKILGKLSGDYV
jgi:hypothetical protein